ncbi:MAG: ribonuclease H family protein [Bacteroidales bacterium]
MARKKYYVVWKGRQTGVFDSWAECKKAVDAFDGAAYKSFEDQETAQKAFAGNMYQYLGKKQPAASLSAQKLKAIGKPIANSISVDAACNMVTGLMEYQGVHTTTREQLFKMGPYQKGSNNIGEFLAIVHALAWCRKHNINLPIYTDSRTAMAWVRKKKANTKVVPSDANDELFEMIERAERWLQNNTWNNPILKWETEAWGEIPADFGRK